MPEWVARALPLLIAATLEEWWERWKPDYMKTISRNDRYQIVVRNNQWNDGER